MPRIEYDVYEEVVRVPRIDYNEYEEGEKVPRINYDVCEEDDKAPRIEYDVYEEGEKVPRIDCDVYEEGEKVPRIDYDVYEDGGKLPRIDRASCAACSITLMSKLVVYLEWLIHYVTLECSQYTRRNLDQRSQRRRRISLVDDMWRSGQDLTDVK